MSHVKATHDYLRLRRTPLNCIFHPTSVAVVGATDREGSVGRSVLWNLICTPFGATIYPINPKRSNVLGIKSYASLRDLPGPVDLAVIVTPAPSVPAVIDDCVAAGVQGAIVISAGFKEIGPQGLELERQVLEKARKARIRIIGPNCLGVMCPTSGLNATFASAMALKGSVGFVSQSGALCTAILDWSFKERVGFSAFVSIGSMLDVDWGDLIYYFGDDPSTRSIVIYMESIGNARSFLSAAREVALTKPIIVIKAGRTAAAAKAAASHTGALAGSDAVIDAAFRRCGVLRVPDIATLFHMAEVLAKQPTPKGPRLTILTNAGGPGVLATDALIGEGGELTALSEQTMKALNEILPPQWSHNNPVDILGDADKERYSKALEAAAKDPNSDGMLTILTPQDMTDPTDIAIELKKHAATYGKPVLASWMGGKDVGHGAEMLNAGGIPCFAYPDAAAKTFMHMWRYGDNLRLLYETPAFVDDRANTSARVKSAALLERLLQSNRTILTEIESKQLLASYGIPTVETLHARSAGDAADAAKSLGFPVAVKLHSETITHKTDVGGVVLNLQTSEDVKAAFATIENSVKKSHGEGHFGGVAVQRMIKFEGYELILGSSIDAQFGPVLLFGLGGQLVEVFKDSSLALPPLTTTLARRMIERTRIATALKGVRGRKPVDMAALEHLLVRFSQLVVEQPRIKEIDINPLLVSGDGMIALDARVILHPPDVSDAHLPKPAIRPYPSQYVGPYTLRSGETIMLRPIRPEDEPLIVRFHEALSDRSVQLRFEQVLALATRVAHERLIRICHNDYDREIALVAERTDTNTGKREIIAIGRMTKQHLANEALLQVVVVDAFQRQGLGMQLVERLKAIARDEGIERLIAESHSENEGMRKVCEKLGYTCATKDADGGIRCEFNLS
jgi:acetyltransferase